MTLYAVLRRLQHLLTYLIGTCPTCRTLFPQPNLVPHLLSEARASVFLSHDRFSLSHDRHDGSGRTLLTHGLPASLVRSRSDTLTLFPNHQRQSQSSQGVVVRGKR